jgi:hypothetical protein
MGKKEYLKDLPKEELGEIQKSKNWDLLCENTVKDLNKISLDSKPPTERDCFKYQLEFYQEKGHSRALEKLFLILVPYARSLILKFKKYRNFFSKEDLKDMSHEVALRVIEQFLKRPGFVIEASFAGYIKWKILEVTGESDGFERAKQTDPITGKQKIMPLLSLNSLLESSKNTDVSIEDLQKELNFTHVGGIPVTGYNQFETLHIEQTVTGVMNIVKTVLQFLENNNAEDKYKVYQYQLFSLMAFHVLFKGGIENFYKFSEFSSSPKLRFILDESVTEIYTFLKESQAVEYL